MLRYKVIQFDRVSNNKKKNIPRMLKMLNKTLMIL